MSRSRRARRSDAFDPKRKSGGAQNAVMHNVAFPRLRGLFGKQRALALDAPAIA
jgi:hypothetical protein